MTGNANRRDDYHIGDVVQFYQMDGMHQMDLRIGTIQTIGIGGKNSFTVDIDCRTFNAFVGGNFALHVTLDVGNRGAAPIRSTEFGLGVIPASVFGAGRLYNGPGSTRTFFYDKNVAAFRDSGGALHFGAWLCTTGGLTTGAFYYGPLPPEYIAALINEIETMIVAQGLQATKGPINPWINVPCVGMLSTDPDYSASNHVGIGMVDIMLNGNPKLGISGIPSRCDLFVEYSNETWNLPGGIWNYHCGMAAWRWGAQNASYGGVNSQSAMTTLRAVQMVQDIKGAYPNESRIKFIAGGLEVVGVSSTNYDRIYGNSLLLTDSAATATIPPGSNPVYYQKAYGNKAPITFFWGFATAPYLDPSEAWNKGNLANSIKTWISNGQKSISSVTQSFPAHVTTKEAHGFKNGDLVVLTDLVAGGDWNQLTLSAFGYVSNVTNSAFDLSIDATSMSKVIAGKITRVNGPDQEAVYASYLRWMLSHGDGQDINSVHSRCKQYCEALMPFGVYHVNYEGWEEMQVQIPSKGYTDGLGFIAGCKRSQAMAGHMTTMMENKKNVYGSYMPAVYTYDDNGRWGFTFPNSYGFAVNGVEWSGLSPSWQAMCDYNAKAETRTIKFIFSPQ